MPAVALEGLEIHYEESGSGDAVVLVNGTGESHASWIGQTMELSERFRCIALDPRDTGRSTYLDAPYAPADSAADVAGVIEALGAGPAHVVGYSLGGAVAQELAIRRPDLVRSLVLLSTWAASDEWFRAQMRSWQALRRAYADEGDFLRALFPWIFAPRTYATPDLVEGYLAFALAEEPRQRPEGFLRQCDADIVHDAAARLGSVVAPALVVVGEHDICTPPRYARALCALLPAAELVVVPDAAHGALFERPDVVNASILRFLAAR